MILGAGGQLGCDLFELLQQTGQCPTGLSHHQLPIEDQRATTRVLERYRPDVIINCAAYNNVTAAQTDPDAAFATNEAGARNLAKYCNLHDALLIHISSDYVFGQHPPPSSAGYTEADQPGPLSAYGQSKLAGELAVCRCCTRYHLVRTAWVFGAQAPPQAAKNFVLKIIHAAQTRPELKIVTDQVGSPTYTLDLAGALLRLIENPNYGTWHITNQGAASWYDLACATLKYLGINTPIAPCRTADFPTGVERPAYSVLHNARWQNQQLPALRPWPAALHHYLHRLAAAGLIELPDISAGRPDNLGV